MRKFKHKITGKVFIETDFKNPECPNDSYYKLDSVARIFYLDSDFIIGSNDYVEIKEESLYTTTDGVMYFEGDETWLWILNKDLSNPIGGIKIFHFSKQDKEVADRYLTFTSAENRDKYIKYNTRKVIFTSADGKEFYNDDMDYSLFSVLPKSNWQENRYRLADCIKFPKKEWLHFHTKEARQEYIDNNKPKYSLKDIESCYPSPLNSPLYETLMSNLKKLGK